MSKHSKPEESKEPLYINFTQQEYDAKFEFISEETESLFFGPLSTVNILVGANNSRKSRFMRMLIQKNEIILDNKNTISAFKKGICALDQLLNSNSSLEWMTLEGKLSEFIYEDKGWTQYFPHDNKPEIFEKFCEALTETGALLRFERKEIEEIKSKLKKLCLNKSKALETNHERFFTSTLFLLKELSTTSKSELINDKNAGTIHFDLIAKHKNELNALKESFEMLLNEEKKEFFQNKIFIPVLRGIIPLTENPENNFYTTTTKHLYIYKKTSDISIFSGDTFYDNILRDSNSGRKARIRFNQFQEFIGKNFFNKNKVEVVADPSSNTERIIRFFVEGEEEREMKDLGDGIQQLLILLYPIFMAKDESWIFIDEPELSLHPGFQNLFLNTILTDPNLIEKKLKYFLSTHSNHLLGQALRFLKDTSIFNFSPKNKDQSVVRCLQSPDCQILNELGVENASVYMANCSIWVEGVSDRRYLQAFLKAYCEEKKEQNFKDGLDYVFFEYAGSNLCHYDFSESDDLLLINALKNANRILLISDEDEGKEEKHNRLQKVAEENKSFEYHTTEALEIENILPPQVLQDFLQEELRIKNPPQLDHSDYESVPLGKFLTEKLDDSAPKLGEKTLITYYKNKLSQFVLSKNYDWETLSKSKHIQRITEAMYKFISKHNNLQTSENK